MSLIFSGNRRVIVMIASDHAHLKRFLSKTRTEVEAGPKDMSKDDDRALRRSLTLHVDYLNRVHHQIEDLLFKQLAKVRPSALGTLYKISQEHLVINKLLKKLLASEGELTGRDQLQMRMKNISGYVDQKLAHIEKEENKILNILENAFTAADWAIVDRRAKELYVTAMDVNFT